MGHDTAKRQDGSSLGPVHSPLWHRTNALLRQAVLRGATRPYANNIIINEYPKSGGSWLAQLVAGVTDLPFPRMTFPRIDSCIMQCHVRRPQGMRNVIVMWRDGRDVMVSYYHHMVVGQSHQRAGFRKMVLRELQIENPANVAENLPRFIERMLTRPISPRFTWQSFADVWQGRPNVVETSYEKMLADPEGELARVIEARTGQAPKAEKIADVVARHSFAKQSGRVPGQEDSRSFLRKGISGDWRNHFTPEAEVIFERHAGAALRRLGYDR